MTKNEFEKVTSFESLDRLLWYGVTKIFTPRDRSGKSPDLRVIKNQQNTLFSKILRNARQLPERPLPVTLPLLYCLLDYTRRACGAEGKNTRIVRKKMENYKNWRKMTKNAKKYSKSTKNHSNIRVGALLHPKWPNFLKFAEFQKVWSFSVQ